ncbi:PepSY-associated TM helix domain-containing protein [Bradyrhizobium oligotrophicum]|uniref:PepSY-associated TM helix domain-containing protein n=1 Tax=Bradyrhizobium oligotrophicum TaxID=44255 RepID=UPI003EBB7098
MRAVFGLVHRWAGLVTAAFLFFSGVTGAVISWDHALDDRLNSHLTEAKTHGGARRSTELAALIEARDRRARVTYLVTTPEAGASLAFFVEPRIDPETGKRFALDYNQVFIDPATGEELGHRYWGAVWPVTRENFVSFLYKLHYTLHIPEFWGSDRWGMRLLGVIAIIWTLDCFVGFYLTLPARRKSAAGAADVVRRRDRGFWATWKPAWNIKTSGSAYRINFDIHRAFGLWTWGVLFVIAFTAFSLNLYFEVFSPLMKTVSSYTPTPFELRTAAPLDQPHVPILSFADVIAKGEADGRGRGWPEPVGAVYYAQQYDIYSLSFFRPGEDHGAGGVGPAQLYYDGQDGRSLGERVPWRGTAADVFVQAQFPMHSGRILGLPGRILISLMGLVVAALSVTGVVIWDRKRRARRAARRSRGGAVVQAMAAAE